MPKKTIEARMEMHREKPRWIVTIPKEIRNGVTRKVFYDERAAKDYAADLQAARGHSVTRLIQLPPGLQGTVLHCLDRVQGDGGRLSEAVEWYLSTHPGQKPPMTLNDLREKVIMVKSRANFRGSYLNNFRSSTGLFMQAMGPDTMISTITPEKVENWLHGNNWATATKRNYRINVMTLFSYAAKHEIIKDNPVKKTEAIAFEMREPGILHLEDVKKLLGACLSTSVIWHCRKRYWEKTDNWTLLPYLGLALFVGIRPDNAALLSRSAIKSTCVDIPASIAKNRVRHIAETSWTARAWLAMPGHLPAINLRKRIDRICSLAKIEWPADCLRHSYCSYSIPIHGLTRTAENADNSEAVLKKHYRKVVEKREAVAFWKLTPRSFGWKPYVLRKLSSKVVPSQGA